MAKYTPGIKSLVGRVYDYRMLVPTKIDGIGRALYVFGERELDHKWILESVLAEGDVILDIGANIGYYAILQTKILNKKCRIYALEPDPRNVNFLMQNIAYKNLDSIITVENGAISNYNGEEGMILDKRTNLSRLGSTGDQDNFDRMVQVKVFDFAEYVQSIPERISLVRMDIEGGEIQVLKSLVDMLKSDCKSLLPKRIVFEIHDYGESQKDVRNYLLEIMKCAYHVEYITSDDELSSNPQIASHGYKPRHVINEWKVSRGIYEGIREEDAALMISQWRGTRTVCLTCNV